MLNKRNVIISSVIISSLIIGSILFAYYEGYIFQPKWAGDYPYDNYICFVYKIEPIDGEGVGGGGGVPDKLTAYIYTNAPENRTEVQFEWEDDNNRYISSNIWLDGQDILGGGSVEKIGQYRYKVSYPISYGYHYDLKSGYKWCLTVWLQDKPHGYSGSSIWYLSELYWTWYKDNRVPNIYKPIADAGGPYIAQSGETIKLDASGSTTPYDTSIIGYYWDLNNDGIFDKYGKTPYVTFQNTGTYTIKLLVVNDKAFYDETTTTVTVTASNNPPVADAGGPYSGNVGDNIKLDGSGSYDPDGNPLSYEWDFDGDGTWDLNGRIVNITYNTEGTYNVVLKVSDGQYIDTDTTTVTIMSTPPPPPTNQPPIADAGGPYTCYVGGHVTLDASGSYDPDGTIVDYKWDIDNNGVWDLSGERVNLSFIREGTFTVKLIVIDNEGASSTDTAIVNVYEQSNTPPTPPSQTNQNNHLLYIILLAIFLILVVGIIMWRNKNGNKKHKK